MNDSAPGLLGTPRRKAMLVLAVVAAAVVLYIPQYYPEFRVKQFSEVIVIAIAVLGLGLLTGYNGQISIGHAAFFGVGAYTTAILVADHGWTHIATMPVAALFAFLVGVAVGVPSLRIRGLYLALVTLALATLFPFVIVWLNEGLLDGKTGGSTGKSAPGVEAPASTDLADDQWVYYVLVVFAVVIFLLVRNMIHSRVGRSIIAVRDDEIAASVLGVNLASTKVFTFGISAMLAGIAGSLSVLATDRVDLGRDGSAILASIELLAAMVIGGAATILGPVVGALFVVFTPEFASDVSPQLSPVIYGSLLIVLMLVLPTGLVGGGHRLEAWILRRIGRDREWRRVSPAPDPPSSVDGAEPMEPTASVDAGSEGDHDP